MKLSTERIGKVKEKRNEPSEVQGSLLSIEVTKSSKQAKSMLGKAARKSLDVFKSSRQATELSNELYKEHFERKNRRTSLQAKELARVKNVTINLKHSKEILANKISV